MIKPQTLNIPVETDHHGVVRIGATRLRLETLVYAFNEGATPEEIVTEYPALNLENVYSVIAYYLKNRPEVDAYLQQCQEERAQIRQEIESRPAYQQFRQRLLSRRNKP